MERLTQATNGVLTYVGPGCQHTNTGDIAAEVDTGGVRLILNRLAAYEDTGFTPEEIEEFDAGLLAAYKETGLEPEEIALYKEAEEISESMAPGRLIELAQAERAGRLVVLPDGDDTAALAATIDSTDMIRVWCGGDGDLLMGLLSMLASEVAKKAGTTYRTLLITMAKKSPIGDGFEEKRIEEGKK